MNPEEFYRLRKADWEQLDALLARCQKSAARLSPADIRTLGRLYRSLTADLALAQRDFSTHPVTQYLNRQAARAHTAIYQSEPLARRRLLGFFTTNFPRAFRANLVFYIAGMLMFILPAVLTGLSLVLVPASARLLLPAGVQNLIPMIESKELWLDIPPLERPFMSSFIMTNNIRVAILAYAGGIPGGLLTVYVLIMNGMILGGLTGLTIFHGVGLDLWNFVIGHGVVELSVIFIAGGAGLSMGWAVIHPGLLSRVEALSQAARRSLILLMGCVPLLVIAGLIEGFISPAENIHPLFKWGVGLATGALLYLYLFTSGRASETVEEQL
jgi:uncharacterized membrane protein SpoIIM required for sporulation